MDKKRKVAKVFLLIPVILLVVGGICLGVATLIQDVTNRGTVYTIFSAIALIALFTSPVVFFVSSIVSIVLGVLSRNRARKVDPVIVLGIIEFAGSLLFLWVVTTMLFISGAGV